MSEEVVSQLLATMNNINSRLSAIESKPTKTKVKAEKPSRAPIQITWAKNKNGYLTMVLDYEGSNRPRYETFSLDAWLAIEQAMKGNQLSAAMKQYQPDK